MEQQPNQPRIQNRIKKIKESEDKLDPILKEVGIEICLNKTEAPLGLDPLMGDSSCQLRTIWLINFLTSSLTPESANDCFKMLGMYKLLTPKYTPDEFGMAIKQEIDAEGLPDVLGDSKKKKEESLKTMRKDLASKIMTFLRQYIIASHSVYKEPLLARFDDNIEITFSGAPLRYIEFFSGYLTITELAKEKQIPIIVVLKHFLKTNDGYKLNGIKPFYFKVHDGKYTYDETPQNTKTPSIIIQAYSAFIIGLQTPNATPNEFSFFYTDNFQELCVHFSWRSPIELILTVAATHQQYPNGAYRREGKNKPSVSTLPPRSDDITELFTSYQNQGTLTGIGKEKYKSSTSERFKEHIPFNIEHVYVSNYEIERVKAENSLKKHMDSKNKDSLKVNKSIK